MEPDGLDLRPALQFGLIAIGVAVYAIPSNIGNRQASRIGAKRLRLFNRVSSKVLQGWQRQARSAAVTSRQRKPVHALPGTSLGKWEFRYLTSRIAQREISALPGPRERACLESR